MNYYIQGDAAKADKIKAAFEKNGVDTLDFGLDNKAIVYFSIGGCVQCMPYNINIMNILKTHPDYNELELPIEPKFKVGDCIANDYCAGKVIALTDDAYLLDSGQGIPFSCEHNAHLWTIADAKEGDVLAIDWHEDGDSWEKIVILKKYHNKGVKGLINRSCVEGYGNTFKNGKLAFNEEVPYYSKTWTYTLQPATAKQRDLLFQKMKENGYEWDFEKKELKKIQPHYDISNFYAGMPVLVRETSLSTWQYVLFSHCYMGGDGLTRFNAGLVGFTQCIPFEGNEHLLGTTDMCDEMYINW